MGYNNNFGIPKGSQPLYPRDSDVEPGLSSGFTFSAGFGTVSNQFFLVRRAGDELIGSGYFTTGTAAGSAAYLTLPPGLHMNASKLPNANNAPNSPSQSWKVGRMTTFTGNGSTAQNLVDPSFAGLLFYAIGDTTNIYFSLQSLSGGMKKINGNALMNSGDSLFVEFSVPIAEWSL